MVERPRNIAKDYVSDTDLEKHEAHLKRAQALRQLFRRITDAIFEYNGDPDKRELGFADTESHADILTQALQDPRLKAQVQHFLGRLACYHCPDSEDELSEIRERYTSALQLIAAIGPDVVVDSLLDQSFLQHDNRLSVLNAIFRTSLASPEAGQRIAQVIMRQVHQSHDIDRICELLQTVYRINQGLVTEYVSEKLEERGFPSDPCVDLWRFGEYEPLDRGKVCLDHFRAFIKIEETHPGVCKFLFENYGITFFGRYSKEALVRQHAESDSDKPYGVMLYAQDDHNGAFNIPWRVHDFYKQIKDKLSLRIVEAPSLLGATRMLVRLHQRYFQNGNGHKIQFLIIGGHGTSHSIQLGDQDIEGNSIYSSDLERSGSERLRSFLTDDATVLLESCSTGDDDGIGQKLSEKMMGVTVVAPKIPTAAEKIVASLDKAGKWTFDILYREDNVKAVYQQGVATASTPAT